MNYKNDRINVFMYNSNSTLAYCIGIRKTKQKIIDGEKESN